MQLNTDKPESSVTLVSSKQAADTAALITNGIDSYPEDSFAGSYSSQGSGSHAAILEPNFKPATLRALTTRNNILAQCIEIMEVNIDGTGHTIELIEGMPENAAELQTLKDFFDEPYPNRSMVSIRRDLRADLESTGIGFLEIIRNISGDLMMMNQVFSDDVRLIRYDDPVMVSKVINRAGKEVEVKVRSRERRFVQVINGLKVYFKEFGSSRDLDRDTGLWVPPGTALPIAKRASELLYFTLVKEGKTPYALPRWINQLPSVLGSRKAEEFNLDFFDSGGMPPVLVLVSGGYLGAGMKDTLTAHLSGKGPKHRAAIVEALSASGSLDGAGGGVQVKVERFGAERQQDSMFQSYDKNCEDHVRASFRLPPLFTGRAQDYNFATAMTGYMTAEAQVFGPERIEFDERMWWVVKALGVRSYMFKSKPMSLTDVATQIKALELVIGASIVDNEVAVLALNTLTGLNLKYQKAPDPAPPVAPPSSSPVSSATPPQPTAPVVGVQDPTKVSEQGVSPVVKAEDVDHHVVSLAAKWATVLGLAGPCTFSAQEVATIKSEVSGLQGREQKLFNEVIAMKSLVDVQGDLEGLGELCGCIPVMGVL